ncbi:hypothetical protein [Polaromonas sp. CG9_12]|nr:hypothetical protein [Polaromonas sp. CG9_12]
MFSLLWERIQQHCHGAWESPAGRLAAVSVCFVLFNASRFLDLDAPTLTAAATAVTEHRDVGAQREKSHNKSSTSALCMSAGNYQ